jgi:transposase-like protein
MKYKSLFDLMKDYNTEEKCRKYFIRHRWENGVVCPHCGNCETETKIYKTKRGIFRCGACSKDFSVRINSFMGDSPIPYRKWLMAIFLLTSHNKGVSSIQLAKDIGITQKSAWFIIQRIAYLVSCDDIKLDGVVEVDETYVGGSEKNKHKDRRTMNFDKGAGEKTAILGMIERGGKVVLKK